MVCVLHSEVILYCITLTMQLIHTGLQVQPIILQFIDEIDNKRARIDTFKGKVVLMTISLLC